jgi:DNA-binding beta-propeller fold protein YncE
VWIQGNTDGRSNNPDDLPNDNEVLKFTHDGTFVMKIGQSGQTGSNSTHILKGATDIFVNPKNNEVYVSDGYGNSRIIVFNADTGEFIRIWPHAARYRPAPGTLRSYVRSVVRCFGSPAAVRVTHA